MPFELRRRRARGSARCCVERLDESDLIAAASRSSTTSLRRRAGLDSGELSLERDHLLHAAPALDERGTHGDEDGDRADRETDEESDDDHRVDARYRVGGRRLLRNRG